MSIAAAHPAGSVRPPKILMVDDEDSARLAISTLLRRAGMDVREAEDGEAALRGMYEYQPDLMILDVNMPRMDGWEVLRRARQMSELPIMMVTAKQAELEKVRGLDGGADDYVTKPFGAQELLARVRSLLRRRPPTATAELLSDSLCLIDLARASVLVNSHEVELTPRELELLLVFVRNPGHVLSHDVLFERAWGEAPSSSRDQVKLYVSYLRRKLSEPAGRDPIATVRGFGYRYRPEPGSSGDGRCEPRPASPG
jgi:DNA-binding response OmpR family regulator